MEFKTLEELEEFLANKTGTTKLLVEEIKKRDSKIAEMQKQIESLSLTILKKAGEVDA